MSSKPETTEGSLIIHPTTVALRQFQRSTLERNSFLDGRGHVTLSSFLRDCAGAAASAGLLTDDRKRPLRPITDLDRELAIVETVARFRAHPPKGTRLLSRLSAPALEQTLAELTDTIAPLAGREQEFITLLSANTTDPKNRELAALSSTYSQVCTSLLVADEAAINASIIALLMGPDSNWPAPLRSAGRVIFKSVRWVAPFQEQVISALVKRLGASRVIVQHILAEHEQDWWGESLMCSTGQLLFGSDADTAEDGREFQSEATRNAIEHLTSLREGVAMQDPGLAQQARPRVGFSSSVGTYGEVEDIARRIAWELHDRPDPLRPEDICLVNRSLGATSDAIINVFGRFGIPCYFRRGIPLLAAPVIKTFINLARFPATRERNVFCSLLQSPWLDWAHVAPIIDPKALADDLLRSGVEPIMPEPNVLRERLLTYYGQKQVFDTRDKANEAATQAVALFKACLGTPHVNGIPQAIDDLLTRCESLNISSGFAATDNTSPAAGILNRKAWEGALSTIENLRSHSLLQNDGNHSFGWSEVVNLLTRAFQNITVTPTPPDESGVWILNPYDMAGLRFKLVIVMGLNAGTFPQLPTPSPLFSDAELDTLRATLARKALLPASLLAASKARNSQENLLFLTTLAAARDRLVFSYASHSEAGEEQPPSVFFSTLWRLAGWPAWPALPAQPPDPYDRWRLNQAATHLNEHWCQHLITEGPSVIHSYKRKPFPGESFMGTIPLPLCRSNDERLQRLALHPSEASLLVKCTGTAPTPALADQLVHGIHMEQQRQAFFQSQSSEAATPGTPQPPSTGSGVEYAGVLSDSAWNGLKPPAPDGIRDFSPSALARLVTCPYAYYLEKVLGIEPVEPNELEAQEQDIGTIIHFILSTGMTWLQGAKPSVPVPGLASLTRQFARLQTPLWAVPDPKGGWHLDTTASTAPSADAIPLVAPPAGSEKDIPAFFEALTDIILKQASSGETLWMLGAPEQVNIQRRRILRSVRNLVLATFGPETLPEDWLPDTGESYRRYPALFEYTFHTRTKPFQGGRMPQAPSILLSSPANPAMKIRVHGQVDRVDLIFDSKGLLAGVLVIDYKGSSKSTQTPRVLASDMALAADCQLPIYGLAVCDKFDAPVAMQYVCYTLPAKDLARKCRKSWLTLDGAPLTDDDLAEICGDAPTLLDAFLGRIFENLARFERGDFAIRPRQCDYCPYAGTCRHSAGLAPDGERGTDP